MNDRPAGHEGHAHLQFVELAVLGERDGHSRMKQRGKIEEDGDEGRSACAVDEEAVPEHRRLTQQLCGCIPQQRGSTGKTALYEMIQTRVAAKIKASAKLPSLLAAVGVDRWYFSMEYTTNRTGINTLMAMHAGNPNIRSTLLPWSADMEKLAIARMHR